METLSSSSIISTAIKPYPLLSRTKNTRFSCSMKVASSFSYQKFIQYALDETKLSTSDLIPSSLQVIIAFDSILKRTNWMLLIVAVAVFH